MRLKILIFLTAIGATFGWHARAQTGKALPSYWVVKGQIYDINKSSLWEKMDGDIVKILTNGIVVSTFTMKGIFQAVTTSELRSGGLSSQGKRVPVTEKVLVGSEKVPGKKIIIRNYPVEEKPAVGKTISFVAMQTGTSDYNGDSLELWDLGTTPTSDDFRKLKAAADEQQRAAQKELDEQRSAAAKAIAAQKQAADGRVINWLLSQATNGNESAQCRLGLRYLKGEGVPKDEKRAREWLGKAAAQGSEEAATALSELNQAATNSPATQSMLQ